MTSRLIAGILLGSFLQLAIAEPVFFPQPLPIPGATGAPAWMTSMSGDDGYVQITAEARLPAGQSCIPLGRKVFIGANTDIQLALSITTFGFGTSFEAREIPFVTFDSRGATGECIAPVKLPVAIVPLTRLETRPAENPGQIRILLNVRSSTNTSLKLVEKAQVALGAAAVVATGGAATTVAGLSTALTNAAIVPLIKEFEQYASNVTAGVGRIDLDWRALRNAPRTYTFQIYEGEAATGESAGEAIKRLQQAAINPSLARFDVRFTLSYVRTIFDPAPRAPTFFPDKDLIQRALVMNYPPNPAIPNLLQTLNSSSPSPLASITAGSSLTDACNDVAAKLLRQVGLNAVDRVVVTKAFVDEALKGDSWLNGDEFDRCFQDQSAAKQVAKMLYSVPDRVIEFDVADMQRDNSPDFKAWKSEIEGPLTGFRRVMVVRGPKEALLLNQFAGNDINVGVYPKRSVWPTPAQSKPMPTPAIDATNPAPGSAPQTPKVDPSFDVAKYPGIAKLAPKQLLLGGCFVWAARADKNIAAGASPLAHMLFAGDNKDVWIANITFTSARPRRLATVAFTELDSTEGDWINLFKGRTFGANAQCDRILAMF